ncbi:hypothetical protein DFH94DRAFT_481359 [Russula ochroleuca]|uniref:Uncharacterized protein n=1 Tax=Russula ochroleuca TaxID=152965 RepID=A0A9P5MWP3_9AGAM|nr:hypothetical protein DFH94DRAFT_481359 [Russula ochroleuca]
MRSTALTALFFALFALFSTVAYATPVAPQGVISKRQFCTSAGGGCRFESNTTSTNDTASVIYDVITNLLGLLGNKPGAPQPAVTVSESSSFPMTQPTVL